MKSSHATALAGAVLLVLAAGDSGRAVGARAATPRQNLPTTPRSRPTSPARHHWARASRLDEDRRDRIREQRRQAFEDTAFDVQGRSLRCSTATRTTTGQLRLGVGGSAGLKTGYFRDRFAHRPDRLHLAADRRAG